MGAEVLVHPGELDLGPDRHRRHLHHVHQFPLLFRANRIIHLHEIEDSADE